MRSFRFLVGPGGFDRGTGARLTLPAEEGRHLRVSLRAHAGLEVHLFDGRGRGFRARLVAVSAARVEAVLLEEETEPVESPLRLVLLQSVSRDETFERVVEQATSLGVSSIVPVLVERAKGGPRAPDTKRLARWRRIAREAAKLSLRRVVPGIEDPITVGQVPQVDSSGSVGLLLDPVAPAGSLRAILQQARPLEVRIAAGPEGGFTEEERGAFIEARFAPVALGPRILRTEHAGPAALAAVLSRWGDLG